MRQPVKGEVVEIAPAAGQEAQIFPALGRVTDHRPDHRHASSLLYAVQSALRLWESPAGSGVSSPRFLSHSGVIVGEPALRRTDIGAADISRVARKLRCIRNRLA